MSLIPEIKERIDAWLEAGSHRSIADLAEGKLVLFGNTQDCTRREQSHLYVSWTLAGRRMLRMKMCTSSYENSFQINWNSIGRK